MLANVLQEFPAVPGPQEASGPPVTWALDSLFPLASSPSVTSYNRYTEMSYLLAEAYLSGSLH